MTFDYKMSQGKNTIFAKQSILKSLHNSLTENQLLDQLKLVNDLIDQANKSARGMPWHQEPMKDVTSCDKLRGAANEHRSGDFRMGKPTRKGIIQ